MHQFNNDYNNLCEISVILDEITQQVVNDNEEEIWKEFVKSTFGSYQISNFGHVRFVTNSNKVKPVKLFITNEGLPRAKIKEGKHTITYPLNRLVADHFTPPKENDDDILININGDLRNNAYYNVKYIAKDAYMNSTFEFSKFPNIQWKPIVGYCKYLASNKGGIIMHQEYGNILCKYMTDENYSRTALMPDTKRQKKSESRLIHLLVADAWLPKNENKKYVDHMDKNRQNNDVCNLRRVTCKENAENRENNYDKLSLRKKIARLDPFTNKPLEVYDSLYLAGIWVKENTNSIHANPQKRFCEVANKDKVKFGFKWQYIDETEQIYGELWKNIPLDITNDKENYQVSNMGRIRYPSGKISHGTIKNGYMVTSIGTERHVGVHIIVGKVWLENADNLPMVQHLNSCKTNNKVENLLWSSYSDNAFHAHNSGEIKVKRKIKVIDTVDNNTVLYDSVKDAAHELNCHGSTILKSFKQDTLYQKRYQIIYL